MNTLQNQQWEVLWVVMCKWVKIGTLFPAMKLSVVEHTDVYYKASLAPGWRSYSTEDFLLVRILGSYRLSDYSVGYHTKDSH